MKCDSQQMADRVAAAGAKKMEHQAYDFRKFRSFLSYWQEKVYYVTNPDKSHRYTVNLADRRCNCEFYKENAEFKTCKHLVWMEAERAYILEIERQAEIYNACDVETIPGAAKY